MPDMPVRMPSGKARHPLGTARQSPASPRQERAEPGTPRRNHRPLRQNPASSRHSPGRRPVRARRPRRATASSTAPTWPESGPMPDMPAFVQLGNARQRQAERRPTLASRPATANDTHHHPAESGQTPIERTGEPWRMLVTVRIRHRGLDRRNRGEARLVARGNSTPSPTAPLGVPPP